MPVTSSSVPPSGRNTSKSSADSGSTTHSLPRALTSEPTANAMAIRSLLSSLQKPAWLSYPGDASHITCAGQADVEQLLFLFDKILTYLGICFSAQYCSVRHIAIGCINYKDALELKPFGPVHGAETDPRLLRKTLSAQTMKRDASASETRLDHVQKTCLRRKDGNVVRRTPALQQLTDLCSYEVALLGSRLAWLQRRFRAGEQTYSGAPGFPTAF